MLIILEGLVMCFWLLLFCVVGIANGPVGLVVMYEQAVQARAVALGLTTKEKIRKSFTLSCIALYVPMILLVPYMVYGINGAEGFWNGFWQMTAILMIQGLFDRFFIDWYWVGKTRAWEIPGTEDLKPYIPTRTKIGKWFATLVVNPLVAAILAGLVTWLF